MVGCAKAPVRKAGGHLSAGRVAEGIEAVSHDNLLAGLREGIEQTAKRLHRNPRDIEKALPWDELSPVLLRILSSQRAAAGIWQKHADAVGGLLTGFAGGTVVGDIDIRKQSAGQYLTILAGRFVRDKQLAAPLKALAGDVLQWEELIERCGDFIEHGDLAATYRRRRTIILVVAASVGVVVFVVAGVVVAMRLTLAASRDRVNAALAGAEPCAVEAIAERDLERALPDQKSRIEAKRAACKEVRRRAKYDASCEALATHLEAGQLKVDDEELLKPETAAVLRRVARGALEKADFLFPEADMPCQDVPKAIDRLWAAYAKAAGGSSAVWGDVERVSEKLRKLLAQKGMGLTEASKQELLRRAETAAQKAIFNGRPEVLAKAKELCEFNLPFGVEHGRNCKGVIKSLSKSP